MDDGLSRLIDPFGLIWILLEGRKSSWTFTVAGLVYVYGD